MSASKVVDLSFELRAAVVRYAREVAIAALRKEPEPPAPDLPGVAGALVALRLDGAPCGFLGSLSPRPLAEAVALAARLAATGDPRFDPGPGDMKLEVEVWLVGPMRSIRGPEDLGPSDGALVRSGLNRGIHLPGLPGIREEATTVLASACVSADLHPETWREPEVEILAFPVDELR